MIQQTDWIERKFVFSFPVGLFPVILERLTGTKFHIEGMVKGKPEEILIKKIKDKWSVKEHIGHLFDLEDLWYNRIEDFLAGKKILRAANINNPRTNEAGHNKKNVGDLIEEFSLARNQLIEKVRDMDEATASISSLHPRLQIPMRLVDHLFFVAEHDDHHLSKIRWLLEQ